MSPGDEIRFTPAEMAERCHVTVDTLRYYERENLLESVERTSGGQRRYKPEDVAWVRILRCLRSTALPIREVRRFAELVKQGDEALLERVTLLQDHRSDVVSQLAELRDALELIDHKIETYSERLDSVPEVRDGKSRPTRMLKGQGATSGRDT